MNKRNYQQEMEQAMNRLPQGTPLLLHVCCAPCASAVIERLSHHFDLTLYFYNPNIWPREEYLLREQMVDVLLENLQVARPVQVIRADYQPEEFDLAAQGLEAEPEGGLRCSACFALRLEQTARLAKQQGMDWFCTTLSISPMKNAALINQLGEELARQYGLAYLPSDFKKKEGYKRSIELSQACGLYRQHYCGCRYSRR